MPHSTRAFTLVETLLALTLASLAVTVALTWMIDGLGASLRIEEHARWERSARALLQRVHDDLQAGIGPTAARLHLVDKTLHIDTIDHDVVVRRAYEFDGAAGKLMLSVDNAAHSPSTPREVALGGVSDVLFSRTDDGATFVVELVGPVRIVRRYRIQ
jgi:type II secretory pathway pseudopilin PulG